MHPAIDAIAAGSSLELHTFTSTAIAETLSNMNIEIFIDESDIGNIKVGQLVEFSTDAFPDRKLEATITQIRYSPIDDCHSPIDALIEKSFFPLIFCPFETNGISNKIIISFFILFVYG